MWRAVYSQHGNGYKTKVGTVYAAVVEDDIGNMPISALKAKSNRAYLCRHAGTGRQADVLCDGNGALIKSQRKGMTYKVLAEKGGLCIDADCLQGLPHAGKCG